MLDGKSPPWKHSLQNISLIVLSLLVLPFSIFVVSGSYVFGSVRYLHILCQRWTSRSKKSTVLVTGVGMTKGLTLARHLYLAGHNVIGADFDNNSCGAVSRCLSAYHLLQKPNSETGSDPYVQSLLEIITRHKVDLWVSCSGVASAVEDGEAKEAVEHRTSCKAIQFDASTTQLLHEKDSFIDCTRRLGLNVPETYTVISASTAQMILDEAATNIHFIVKPIGMDDIARGDMTLLPLKTTAATSKHLERLRISKKRPYIMQQFVKGEEFCTHALVIRGTVKAFVSCPSQELLMHYEALPEDSALNQAMLSFTKVFASKSGNDFTGHLSFDFIVPNPDAAVPDEIALFPIECNPRAHTAVILFRDTPQLADAYLSICADVTQNSTVILTPAKPDRKYYWIGHDLVALIVWPLLARNVSSFFQRVSSIVGHLLTWHDGTYEVWDPLPFFWLYQIYWPLQFLKALRTHAKWSRINVSTTKMFQC